MNNQTIAWEIIAEKLPGFEGKNPWIDSKLDGEKKGKALKNKEKTIYNRFVRWIPKIKKNEDF